MTGSRPRSALKGWLFGTLVALSPNLAIALETTLSAPGASEDLVDRLEETSSVFTSESRGLDTSLEILSAAGVTVAENPAVIGETIARVMGKAA